MEGVFGEASSYAAKQNLDKLIVLYDSNDICLDSETNDAFTENIRARYDAYGWHTALVEAGTDVNAISFIEEAKDAGKPSLIEVKTVIGHGAPTKGVPMLFMVRHLVKKKPLQHVRILVGIMPHLKFLKKFTLILKKMSLTAVRLLTMLGQILSVNTVKLTQNKRVK